MISSKPRDVRQRLTSSAELHSTRIARMSSVGRIERAPREGSLSGMIKCEGGRTGFTTTRGNPGICMGEEGIQRLYGSDLDV